MSQRAALNTFVEHQLAAHTAVQGYTNSATELITPQHWLVKGTIHPSSKLTNFTPAELIVAGAVSEE